MDLIPDDDQQQIIAMASNYLAKELPLGRLRGASYDIEQARVQRRSFAEMGWHAIGLAEEQGGVGMSVVEEMLIFRELGRVVGPTAPLPTILAIKLCARADLDALRDRLISGEAGAALAVAERPICIAGPSLVGPARIYDLADAACIVAMAGDEVFLLDANNAELAPLPWLDEFTSVARRDLAGLPILARQPALPTLLNGALLTAAMLAGLADGAVAMAVDYAKVRETFGRKIGAYQAVRHPLAEAAARSEHAKSLLYYAALALASGRDDAELQIRAAKVVAQRTATRNADINIQLHGGIGITADLAAHHFMKRALMLSSWFGTRKAHLDALLSAPLATI